MQRDQQQLGTLIGDRDRLLASTRGDLFKRLYDAAQAVIAKGIWTEDERCPLCESELGSSITAQISGQLAQYREAENKATEISNAWQASAWRKCLTDYEEAKPLGFETQKRQLAGLDSMIAAGKITRDDLTAAIRWTSDLITQASSALSAAQERKTALERELPPSLVQLTEQVEYGRQFQQALERYREKQGDEVALQARLDVRERWKGFITRAATLFADAEVALSKAKIGGIQSENKGMFREIMKVADVVPELQRANAGEDLHVQLSDFHGQVSQAEPLIRQYLEYKLQQIIRRVDIPVPIDFAIKDTSRMVGNCLDAITTAVNLHKRAGTLILDAQQISDLDTVHVPAIVGNWVSHNETGSGSSLSAPVLSAVISSIDALAECFRYDDSSSGTATRRWYRSLSSR